MSAPAPAASGCRVPDDVLHELGRAVSEHDWLRARALFGRVPPECVVSPSRAEVAEHLSAASEQPREALGRARELRLAGRVVEARELEGPAVAALEHQSGRRLALVPRWSTGEEPRWSLDGKHLLFNVDDEVVVVDAERGLLRTRVALDSSFESRIEVNAEAGVLLISTLVALDLSAPCMAELRVFELASGLQRKTLCGLEWTFSRDGKRLAYRELVHVDGMDRPLGRLVVLDTHTFEPIRKVPELPPDVARSDVGWLVPSPSGNSVVVDTRGALSVVELSDGSVRTFAGGGSDATYSPDGEQLAWIDGQNVMLWRRGTQDPKLLARDCESAGALSFALDGKRIAVSCAPLTASSAAQRKTVVWDIATRRALVTLPHSYPNGWVQGSRGFAVSDESVPGVPKSMLFDMDRKRFVPIGPPRRDVDSLQFLRGTQLATVDRPGKSASVYFIDRALAAHELPLGDCRYLAQLRTEPGDLLLPSCDTQKSIDPLTGAVRTLSSALDAPVAVVRGTAVVHYGDRVELRRIDSGELVVPKLASLTPMRGAFWQGDTLVLEVGDYLEKPKLVRLEAGRELASAPQQRADCPNSERAGAVLVGRGDKHHVVCDRASGGELGRLALAQQWEGALASTRGSYLLVTSDPPKLVKLATGEARTLDQSFQTFGDDDTLIGQDSAGARIFVSASSGRRLAIWPRDALPPGATVAATAVARDLAIVLPGSPMPLTKPGQIELRKLGSGALVATLPLVRASDASFGPGGTVTLVADGAVRFFSVSGEPLGVIRASAATPRVLFSAASGAVELTGEFDAWRSELRCQVGASELPFELCGEALRERGLFRALLAPAPP